MFRCLFLTCISCRSLVCMEGHCLVLPIEHLGESVLLLLQLFQQSSLCPYQVMEAAVFLLFLLMMMDFLHKDLLLRQHLKTSSYTGETYNFCEGTTTSSQVFYRFDITFIILFVIQLGDISACGGFTSSARMDCLGPNRRVLCIRIPAIYNHIFFTPSI